MLLSRASLGVLVVRPSGLAARSGEDRDSSIELSGAAQRQPEGCISRKSAFEKVVEINAPVGRVWRALTDFEEFGEWFRVKLDGPFEPGAVSRGEMTYPGFEGWPWLATVERMEPERLFSFRWHDYDSKSGVDVAEQPATLVEFRLQAIPEGTRLTITESGFSAIPDPRRFEVLRDNTQGWNIQARNILAHVASAH
ncbi:MAG TPA: SRPBCC family protein [Gammaproteobacteria bacterium]